MKIEIIDEKLNRIFNDAIDVNDTIWYSESETLLDCILTMIEAEIKNDEDVIIEGVLKNVKEK